MRGRQMAEIDAMLRVMGELLAALAVLLLPWAGRCEALAALDVVRGEAWSTGDAALLATVYADGAGEDDMARLRAWRGRGTTVEQMRMLRSSCRESGATTVEVVERLGPAVAVLPDGRRRPLPQDSWDRRVIDLQHLEGRWRIVRVS